MRARERALRERAAGHVAGLGLRLMVGRGDNANWRRDRAELRHRAGRSLTKIVARLDPETAETREHLRKVVALHRRELLAYGQYAAIVHPEDLPPEYRPGMKLVSYDTDDARRYEAALRQIRALGGVCENYEVCDHRACRESYGAWSIADETLTQ